MQLLLVGAYPVYTFILLHPHSTPLENQIHLKTTTSTISTQSVEYQCKSLSFPTSTKMYYMKCRMTNTPRRANFVKRGIMHYARHRIPLLTLTLSALFTSPEILAAKRVSVRAIASETYLENRAKVESDEIETYQFFQGRYFGARASNSGMEKLSFKDVVVDMAQHLAKQNYYPNPELGKGDLLIVVHYGITDIGHTLEENIGNTNMEDMGITDSSGGSFDAIAELEFALGVEESLGQHADNSSFSTAQLLGMEAAFEGHPSLEDSNTMELRNMIEEERYFVFLMAYDYPKILKEGKQELLWSTRYSIRAAGIPFEAAIKNLNQVAGDYFGKNLKGLTRKRADDTSSVDLGEIEVIENGDQN